MAITKCEPCSCIGGNIGNEKFKQDTEVILCQILAAIQAGGAVCVADSSSIDFSLTEGGCVTGSVLISADADNALSLHADGLYATDSGGTPTLTATQIAFGDVSNLMTSSANLIYAFGNVVQAGGQSVGQYKTSGSFGTDQGSQTYHGFEAAISGSGSGASAANSIYGVHSVLSGGTFPIDNYGAGYFADPINTVIIGDGVNALKINGGALTVTSAYTTLTNSHLLIQALGAQSGDLLHVECTGSDSVNMFAFIRATVNHLSMDNGGSISSATSWPTASRLIGTDTNSYLKEATVSSPLSFSALNLAMSQADTSTDGWLSSTDWNSFNGKQGAISSSANQVVFADGSNVIGTSSNFTWDGTTLSLGATQTFANLNIGATGGAVPSKLTVASSAGGSSNPYIELSYGGNILDIWADTGTADYHFKNYSGGGAARISLDNTLLLPSYTGSTPLYVNASAGLASTTISAPLDFTTGTLSIPLATTSQDGYLSQTDWDTFNNSVRLDQTSAQTFTGGALTGSGLLNVTSGVLGLDTSAYITSSSVTITTAESNDGITPIADNTYTFDTTTPNTSIAITTVKGVITAITII